MTDETPDVTARARAALDGITPGEWRVFKQSERHDDDPEWVIESNGGPSSDNPIGVVGHGVEQGEVDATFIADSPDLVRDLLAENEQLRDDLRVERITTHMCESVDADLREARTEVERLTAERDQAIAAHQRAEARATLHREERDEAHAAVDRVRKMHRKVPIYTNSDDCGGDHDYTNHIELSNGEIVCPICPPFGWTCAECGAAVYGSDDYPEWPCDTIRALDGKADRD